MRCGSACISTHSKRGPKTLKPPSAGIYIWGAAIVCGAVHVCFHIAVSENVPTVLQFWCAAGQVPWPQQG